MSRERSFSTEKTKRLWDAYAPRYDRDIGSFERVLFAGGREWACAQAQGDVLEIAMGTGRNLEHYPEGVRLTGIELSEAMLDIARSRAAAAKPDADLRLGDAQALEFPDESFDTVLVTLGLCVIPNEGAAVAEARRVLRPGGHFVAVEHVASPNAFVRGGQMVVEVLSFRWTGDHQTRDPVGHLRATGFEIEHLSRLKWGIVERVVARKP